METFDFNELQTRRDEWDQAVACSEDVDRFCSMAAWSFSAADGLMPGREVHAMVSQNGWAAFARSRHSLLGSYYEPLEAMWGFACPLAGPDFSKLLPDVLRFVQQQGPAPILLLGVRPNGALWQSLGVAGRLGWSVSLGSHTRRCHASLEGGLDGFLSRRSRQFRYNLKRSRRAVEREGIAFELVSDCADHAACELLFERILRVEERSWKGRDQLGIQSGHMSDFYRVMLPRLAHRSALRVLFAVREGEDLAYHFGGVHDGVYRGLQHSYDQRFRSLSLGTVTQAQMLQRICEAGTHLYDLGQNIAYKERWSENTWDTVGLLLRPEKTV